ncbi:unnamed protein product, partial [Ilex paraguariensis]
MDYLVRWGEWAGEERGGGESRVTLVMGGGQEMVEIRKQAKELGAAMKKDVESGNSSEAKLIALINELKAVKQGATTRD